MIEKKRLLTVETNTGKFDDISLDTKKEVSKFFPYYVPDDGKEMREEVNQSLFGLIKYSVKSMFRVSEN